MAQAAIGLAALGAVASLTQGFQAANQAETAGKTNQEILDYDARQAQARSEIEAQQQSKADRRLLAAQRARFGAAGLDPGAGSALTVQADTAYEAELTRQRILAGGGIEAARLRNEGKVAKYTGKATAQNYRQAGYAGFLSGLGQAGNLYTQAYGV